MKGEEVFLETKEEEMKGRVEGGRCSPFISFYIFTIISSISLIGKM